MDWRGSATIEEDEFNDLIGKITNIIDDVRKWHADIAGKCVRFVTISHKFWDGKRERQTGFHYFSCVQEHLRFTESPCILHLLWDKIQIFYSVPARRA